MRVSLIGFGPIFAVDRSNCLDGLEVPAIHADLTAGIGIDLTKAKPLPENANTAYLGIQKTGPFDLPGETGRSWLGQPNPHGRPNSDIVKPWFNGLDITRRQRDMWIVDFGTDLPEAEASLYELPFAYAKEHVQPTRVGKREARTNEMWWLFQWSRPLMRKAIKNLPRFIVTPEVSKHRVFAFMMPPTVADKNLTVIARSDDTTFGILHSRFHELWSLRLGTSLEDRPRYTPTTCFETFPFPEHLTPRDTAGWGAVGPISEAQPHEGQPSPSSPCETNATPPHHLTPPSNHQSCQASPPCMAEEIIAANIAAAARKLNQLRENWLNPPEWVDWVITKEEEQAGFPKRPVAKPGHEADLKKRTLTNLYNARPAWLDLAHKALDQAVAVAYGWTDYTVDTPDDEILRRLLALNLERSRS